MRSWLMLRRRMVHLLVGQGRHNAAAAHVEQGLQECLAAHDEVARVEFLAAKVRIDVLSGKLLELRGDKRIGAVPAAETCLSAAAKHLPIATVSAVYARLMLYLLLEQNPALEGLGQSAKQAALAADVASEAAASSNKNVDPNEELVLEAQGKIIISPIAKDLISRSKPSDDAQPPAASEQLLKYRERQLGFVAMVTECIKSIDGLLDVQGFQLHPHNLNSLLQIGDGPVNTDQPELPLLPGLKAAARDRPDSDSRSPPNIYLEPMQLRLHCELRLAGLRLSLGDLEAVEALLREAEARMARCIHLLPWLYVQFCLLKLHWRRLSHQQGSARFSAPPDSMNHELFRDEKAFKDGICPSVDSPVFRTFLKRAKTPSLTQDSEWVPPANQDAESALAAFLQELVSVAQVSGREGGQDCAQLLPLLREGLEEVLRVRGKLPLEGSLDLVHALFSCLVSVAESSRALLFEPAGEKPAEEPPAGKDAKGGKGGGGAAATKAPFEAEKLPPRVALDVQAHLKRQAVEGEDGAHLCLAYSDSALQEAQKSLSFQAVVRHALALRRECDTFAGFFHSERLLCDQLHVALAQASDVYSKAKVIDAGLLEALAAPPETPSVGDVLIHWMALDGTDTAQPPGECCAFLACIAPLAEEAAPEGALVARCREVEIAGLKRLLDGLCADLEHCKPAAAVSTEFVGQRLRTAARTLRGVSLGAEPADAALEAALQALLASLSAADAGAEPAPLGAEKVRSLLQALIQLVDRSCNAARVSHPDLGRFLRAVLAPLRLFAG